MRAWLIERIGTETFDQLLVWSSILLPAILVTLAIVAWQWGPSGIGLVAPEDRKERDKSPTDQPIVRYRRLNRD